MQMKNLEFFDEGDRFEMKYYAYIGPTIREAIKVASNLDRAVTFEFYGTTITVEADSDAELIYRDQGRAFLGYIDKRVGPYPKETLSGDELANDARIQAENDKRNEEKERRNNANWERRQAEAQAKREALEAKLETAPEMEFSDRGRWTEFVEKQSKVLFGYGLITFSERWARLMQQELDNGSKLEDIAQTTSIESDLEGLSGQAYDIVVTVLSACWKHGERFRQWHNLHTRPGNKGERANESGEVLRTSLLP